MDALKTILMGCGALAILTVGGCVGLASIGSYAVNQAIEEERAREARYTPPERSRSGSARGTKGSFSDDPFGEYEGTSYDAAGEPVGGWGDEAQQ